MNFEDVLAKFYGIKRCNEKQYMARCPCHDDRKQSLSIGLGEKGVVLKCQAGCDTSAILERVGLKPSDLFYEPRAAQNKRPEIVAIYEYPNGVQKLRYSDKHFTWRKPDGNGGWIYNRQGVRPVLYVAGEIAGNVAIVEGEKDADNIHKLGLNAVSGADGAGKGKWKPEYTKQLEGATAWIFQDNDEVGKEYAAEIAQALYGTAAHVYMIDLQTVWKEIPEHGDVSDLIEHFGREKATEIICGLIENASEWTPPKKATLFESFGFYTVPDLTDEERKPPEFIVDGMIPCGMTFISGAPKIRKSFLALQMAAAVATGGVFLGHKTTRCDVAYLDLEGSKSRVSSRTSRMTVQIPRNVFITNAVTEKLADGLVNKLRQLHRERPQIRLIIIDTYSRSRGAVRSVGGANAYDSDVALLEPVQRMALEENIAIVFVHHDKKGAGFATDSFERLSGTMGISGSADAVLNLVADGKRFDGKATLEYTPRDARGGEKNLCFDECCCEWKEAIDTTPDIKGNPICSWILNNIPDRGLVGDFYSYNDLHRAAYGCQSDKAGDTVRKTIDESKDVLYGTYRIGVQCGVKCHGERGVRLINLL